VTENITTDETIEIPVGQQSDGTVETGEVVETEVDETADTFPRKYVEDLRTESAKHRTEAKEAREALEPLQQRLLSMLVEKTGRLADPTDLAFDAALLDEGLEAAIDALLETKPHLASRRVVGDIGQGAGAPVDSFSLAGLLNATA
jgi:hypothetical protein